ncbi:MAG: preprotein translocase subunit SecA [Parcubacteria group bacterium]|nr:preprotein translocase subunit SecA [Parcubacteria group bacterium]
MAMFTKLFGDENSRFLKRAFKVVAEINALEPELKKLSDEELKNKTQEFKSLLASGGALDAVLPSAFAVCREASVRTLGQRHFDVQLIGGLALHEGKIAEMRTGEGKTLTATLAVYLNALAGQGVHIVTVNDYLARRDTVWMGQIYHMLGMTVGCINHDTSYIYDSSHINPKSEIQSSKQIQNSNDQKVSDLVLRASDLDHKRDAMGSFKVVHEFLRPCNRSQAYRADITYGTNNEYGFDYLRDNLVYDTGQFSQRGQNENDLSTELGAEHVRTAVLSVSSPEFMLRNEALLNFAIVDEVDSILIDEARTPLIISQPDEESGELYQKFARLVPKLNREEHYIVDEKRRAVTLTQPGISKVENILGVANLYEEGGIRLVHHLEQALKAEILFKRDKDYIVKDGEVVIVDEFTGRLMPGRRYSEGLHQAIEAKEGVMVKRESRTVATITFQNYFRLYKKIAGMSGTAATSQEEFHKVYNLDVVTVPTHKPMIRRDEPDVIYRSEKGKFQAVLRKVKELHEKGQPVLLGTGSIEKNEQVSALLNQIGVPHKMLNAKNHEAEAQIIAQAGQSGAVTLATNIAGRGVDIILGGNPGSPREANAVREAGGLFVLSTERHEARRIDNQLRGRAGRQGDPGQSQFFVSLEDDLMRVFGGDRIKSLMARFNIPEDEAIKSSLVSKAIESAQAKIEGYHFDTRKHVLEYDEVMNKHREVIYKMRREFIGPDAPIKNKERVLDILKGEAENLVAVNQLTETGGFDVAGILKSVSGTVPLSSEAVKDLETEAEKIKSDREKLTNLFFSLLEKSYQAREQELGLENMRQVERLVLLRTIDELWMDHLDEMEHLRDSVNLRAYGQRDPLVEYKTEGHRLFQSLLGVFESQVAGLIFKVGIIQQQATSNKRQVQYNKSNSDSMSPVSRSHVTNKVGRNDPCPCGALNPQTGERYKYKKCGLINAPYHKG